MEVVIPLAMLVIGLIIGFIIHFSCFISLVYFYDYGFFSY